MLYEIDGKSAFRIELYDNAVAHKWKKLIQSIYVGDGEDIDSVRTFFKFRSQNEIQEILLRAITNINNFLKRDFIKVPTHIDWNDQELYNDWHKSFELLAGEFDKPTKLMALAPLHIQESIRDLNFCVHALEDSSSQSLNIQWTKKRSQLPRIKLQTNEYELTQFHMTKNEVYLGYNEVGKSYIDLWKDNLPSNYKATKNNHYIGPDIKIAFTNKENIFADDFINWCIKNVHTYWYW